MQDSDRLTPLAPHLNLLSVYVDMVWNFLFTTNITGFWASVHKLWRIWLIALATGNLYTMLKLSVI